MAAKILTNGFRLSEEEKALRKTFQGMIEQLKQLQNEVNTKQADLELISFEHFSEIRRQIDILREALKKKIDKIALKCIDQANEKEKAYKLRINESFHGISEKELNKSSQLFMDEFKKPNLILENVKRLMSEQELQIKRLQAKLADFHSLKTEIDSVEFRFGKEFQEENFGTFKLSKPLSKLVSTSADNSIKIWDLATLKCISTLEGHTMRVVSLEDLGNRRIATGCDDGTIKIWNMRENVCLKTIVGVRHTIVCLKSLNANTLASGSLRDIKIWNIDSGACVQTLLGHTDWIRRLTQSPDGALVSCSDDKTIKMWDATSGACIKTFNYPNIVICLTFLSNGRLVSGSQDHLINIWNIESGACIDILREHSGSVLHLQTLESGELVSCSADGTIKIWDLDTATCKKTLRGHTRPVRVIKVGANNTLISFSDDGTIQVWDMDTYKCVNKIYGHDGSHNRDLLVI